MIPFSSRFILKLVDDDAPETSMYCVLVLYPGASTVIIQYPGAPKASVLPMLLQSTCIYSPDPSFTVTLVPAGTVFPFLSLISILNATFSGGRLAVENFLVWVSPTGIWLVYVGSSAGSPIIAAYTREIGSGASPVSQSIPSPLESSSIVPIMASLYCDAPFLLGWPIALIVSTYVKAKPSSERAMSALLNLRSSFDVPSEFNSHKNESLAP